MTIARLDLGPVPPLDTAAMDAARQRWASRAKPPGALGRLEALGVHLAGVTGLCPPPPVQRPAVAVFAADHGVVADGASAWPSEVTAMMVSTMADRRAAINVLADVVGASVTLVDVGVAAPTTGLDRVLQRKVREGTANLAREPAMTVEQAAEAFTVGHDIGMRLLDDGHDCLVGGDMGIGNTTPSAALISALTGTASESVTGPGAGLPAERLDNKRHLVDQALARVGDVDDPVELLAEVGGLEIGALAGFYVAAATRHTPYIIDGVIACAAACVADAIAPGTAARGIAGHRSTEPAATVALEHLGLSPLLDLGLRLGEGTGACLAIPLVQAAGRALGEMADLPV